MTNSFSYLEPVCCSMSSSNCCFLTCIQVSQEAGQVVWYSHIMKNFPQFIVIHTVKGYGIVNKAEIDVFLELSCFFYDPADVTVNGLKLFLRKIPKVLYRKILFFTDPLWSCCHQKEQGWASRAGTSPPKHTPQPPSGPS